MSNVTLEEVVQMIARLSPEDRILLVQSLKATEPIVPKQRLTREMILAEHARRLAAGEFEHAESLLGRYEKQRDYPSDDELESSIKTSANEWEQELDDYGND
jgi:hypothetical protein